MTTCTARNNRPASSFPSHRPWKTLYAYARSLAAYEVSWPSGDLANRLACYSCFPLNRLTEISAIDRIREIRNRLRSRSPDVNQEEGQASRLAENSPVDEPRVPRHQGMDEVVTTHDGKTYSEAELYYLTNEIKDYQIVHGSLLKVVQYETESSVPARAVGVSLLPTPFPKNIYGEAMELQQIINELYARVAADPDWLYSVLGKLMKHDSLVSALWNVYLQVKEAGAVQNTVCGVFRSDYMLHQPSAADEVSLKQVEVNTFSCAGVSHAQRIANMHKHLNRVRSASSNPKAWHDDRLPQSKNTEAVVSLLKAAHEHYKPSDPTSKTLAVLMPVQPYNFNIADERPIELGLWQAGIPCYRCEWRAGLDRTTLTDDRTLLFRPTLGPQEVEISVIYYRAGYAASEYLEPGMQARVRFELSRAIKCPDILTNITNFKAVQAALSQPGELERFLPVAKAKKVRKTFMPMQVLDTSTAGLEARRIALDPELAINYVLKPNLEGGGHNTYRAAISAYLKAQPSETWKKYIIMRLIEPPATTGTLMMPHDLYHGEIISELGVWGTCLWERNGASASDGGGIMLAVNEAAGWTFKSKPADVDEMSVVKGFGCFDCPLLS